MQSLLLKITNKSTTIAIIGQGYIGLPTFKGLCGKVYCRWFMTMVVEDVANLRCGSTKRLSHLLHQRSGFHLCG